MESIFITVWLFGVSSLAHGVIKAYTVPSAVPHYVQHPKFRMIPGHHLRQQYVKQRVLMVPTLYYKTQQVSVTTPSARKVRNRIHHGPRKSDNDRVHLMTLIQNRNKVLMDRGYRMFNVNRNKPLKKGVATFDSQIRKRTSVGMPVDGSNNTGTLEKGIINEKTTTTTKPSPPPTTTPPPPPPPPALTTTKIPIQNKKSPALEKTVHQTPKPDTGLCIFTVDCEENVSQKKLKLPNLTGVGAVRETMSIIEDLITNLFQNNRIESSINPLNRSTNVNNAGNGFGSGNVDILLPIAGRNSNSSGVTNGRNDPGQTQINTSSDPGIRKAGTQYSLSRLPNGTESALNISEVNQNFSNIGGNLGNQELPRMVESGNIGPVHLLKQLIRLINVIHGITSDPVSGNNKMQNNNITAESNSRIRNPGGFSGQNNNRTGTPGVISSITNTGSGGSASRFRGNTGGGSLGDPIPVVNSERLNPIFLKARSNIGSQAGSGVLGSDGGDITTTLLYVLTSSISYLNSMIRNSKNINSPSESRLGRGRGPSGTASGQGTRHPLDHVISLLHEIRGTPMIQNRTGGIGSMGRDINGPPETRGAPNSRSQSELNSRRSSTVNSGTLTSFGNANGGGLGMNGNQVAQSSNQLDQVINLLREIHRRVGVPRGTEGIPPSNVIRTTQPQIPTTNSVFGGNSNMQNPSGRISIFGGKTIGRSSGNIRDQLINVLLEIERPAHRGSRQFGNNMNQNQGFRSSMDMRGNSAPGQSLGQSQNPAFGSLSSVIGNSGAGQNFEWGGGGINGADVIGGNGIGGNFAFGPLNGNGFNTARLGDGGSGTFGLQGRSNSGAGQSLDMRRIRDPRLGAMDSGLLQTFVGRLGSVGGQQNMVRQSPELFNTPRSAVQEAGIQTSNQIGGSTQQMEALQDILRQVLRRTGPDAGQPGNSLDPRTGQGSGMPNNAAQNTMGNTNNSGIGIRGNNNRNGTSDLMLNIAILERLKQRLNSGNGITGGNQDVTFSSPNTGPRSTSNILFENISNLLFGPVGAGARG